MIGNKEDIRVLERLYHEHLKEYSKYSSALMLG